MRIQWVTAVLLGSALAVGCGDRGSENARNVEENATIPPTEGELSAAETGASTRADSSALRQDADGTRAATGNRVGTGSRPNTGARVEPAPTVRRDNTPVGRNTDGDVDRDAAGNRRRAAPVATVREVTIPAGTSLPLELTSSLSSETAQIETPVTARLRQPVVINGTTAIPVGAIFHGEVIDVDRPGRVQGRARLAFRFTSVAYGGSRETVRTDPLTFQGEATKGEDATKIGAGAGVGAVIGGILGGGDGAAKGAAIGGAAGTGAVLATRGRDVELGAGTDLNATVASPASVTVR